MKDPLVRNLLGQFVALTFLPSLLVGIGCVAPWVQPASPNATQKVVAASPPQPQSSPYSVSPAQFTAPPGNPPPAYPKTDTPSSPYVQPTSQPSAAPPEYGPGRPAPGNPMANSGEAPPGRPALNFNTPVDDSPDTFLPAQVVAVVGDQPILAGDVEGTVNQILAINTSKAKPEELAAHRDEIEKQKKMLFRQQLSADVQNKMLFLDFLRLVPADKLSDVQKRLGGDFEKELDSMREKLVDAKGDDVGDIIRRDATMGRLAMLMKIHGLETLGELDALLRNMGSSLGKQRQLYLENRAGQMMVFKNIKQNVEISHDEMLRYYREQASEYAIPAKARWEQLTVRFDRFPDRDAALQALAAMGNEVYLGGAQFAAVAQRSSQEPNADQGGQHDFTSKGSLASKPLDEAIFTLPLNRLSQIIEDQRGLHIIRVLQRTEATMVSFLDAQDEIKEKIKQQRRQADIKKYIDGLQAKTPIWTVFDDEKDASQTAGRKRLSR